MIGRFVESTALVVGLAVLALLASDVARADTAVRIEYGVVEAIDTYRSSDDKPLNAGTVIGGIAGGVLGHQIGRGGGNTAATIAGAVGGAVVGHEVQKKATTSTRYRITVRLDNGSTLVVEESPEIDLRVGDRVRVENGRVHRV